MSETLKIYAGGSDLTTVEGCVGLLCELAPDSPSLRKASAVYTPDDLLGSPDESLKHVYPLVSKLLASAPTIEGLPVLRIFEEDLLEQASYILRTFHLDRWIASRGFSTCRFFSYSPWLDRLRHVRAFSNTKYELRADIPLGQSSPTVRAFQRLWRSRPAPAEFLRRAMPHRWRWFSAMGMRKRAERAPRGGIWFYSTSYNCTGIGLEYEPYFPQNLNFLVEDPTTGGKRLRELGRDFDDVYAWSRASDIPSRSEIRAAAQNITQALATVPLSDPENAIRSVLLQCEWWRHFLERELPFALHNNRALRKWRKAVDPELLVVGNAGWERALLLREDAKHVPSVMLQHGIMHWVFGVTDEPVDRFLVRGPFFQRMVNEKLRRKIVVLNSPSTAIPDAEVKQKERSDVLFITAPFDVPALFHREDLRDILRSLLRACHAGQSRLTIRVHPMETIAEYEATMASLQQDSGFDVDVRYSQGPGVEEVLRNSCVAILFFSTMFLDCLRYGIPIVSFDWHWFANKDQFEREGIFNFAQDLKHFELLVQRGIGGKLRRCAGLEEFLAQTASDEIVKYLKETWDARHELNGPGIREGRAGEIETPEPG